MRNSGVYLIRCTVTGLHKIGVAVDVRQRLATLQVGSAPELALVLVLPGDEARERALHERYHAKRVRGEWFALDEGDVADLRAMVPPEPTAEPPRVSADRLVPPPRGETHWTVKITCPYCGRTHTHGAGIDGTDLGHRAAHCWDENAIKVNSPGYVITKPVKF